MIVVAVAMLPGMASPYPTAFFVLACGFATAAFVAPRFIGFQLGVALALAILVLLFSVVG